MANWTVKYAAHDAGGGGDGSSGSPWTITQAFADTNARTAVYFRPGTYTPTVELTPKNLHAYIGVDGSDNPVVSLDDTLPVFDFTGQVTGNGLSASSTNGIWVHGLDVRNVVNTGIYLYRAIAVSCCRVHSCGTYGIHVNAYATVAQCDVYDNVSFGVNMSSAGAVAYRCQVYDNGVANINAGGGGNAVIGCEFPNATDATLPNILTNSNACARFQNSFFDGASHLKGEQQGLAAWNIFKDAATSAVDSTSTDIWLLSNVFHGNTADIAASSHVEVNSESTNPSYTDPSTQDLSIGEATYQGYTVTLGNMNLGADQGRAGAGSSNTRRSRGRHHNV